MGHKYTTQLNLTPHFNSKFLRLQTIDSSIDFDTNCYVFEGMKTRKIYTNEP